MNIKNKIISGAIAAIMLLNPIAPFSTVFADEISEPAETVTIETEASETSETEEHEETEQTEETVESEVEYTVESEETQPEETETVISETSETTETRAPPTETEETETTSSETVETEPEETENEAVIVEASDNEDILRLFADIPYGYRLIVRAPVDLTDVNVYFGVYFDGSYVLSFESQFDYDAAVSYFESEGIEYSEDGEFGICGGSGLINNVQINPDATTKIAIIDTGSDIANEAVSVISDDASDANGHGTAMASYVLENTDDAYIISIKAFGSDGKGDVSDVYAAVQYAINSDVDVILMAFSLRDNGNYDAFKALVAEAEANGITIIAAAGNKNADASGYIPANISGVITVGAVDADGYKLTTSNYGDAVNYYVNAESTSQAAAVFAGKFIAGSISDVATSYETDSGEYGTGAETLDPDMLSDDAVFVVDEITVRKPSTVHASGDLKTALSNEGWVTITGVYTVDGVKALCITPKFDDPVSSGSYYENPFTGKITASADSYGVLDDLRTLTYGQVAYGMICAANDYGWSGNEYFMVHLMSGYLFGTKFNNAYATADKKAQGEPFADAIKNSNVRAMAVEVAAKIYGYAVGAPANTDYKIYFNPNVGAHGSNGYSQAVLTADIVAPRYSNFYVQKEDQNGTPLAGAVFSIYKDFKNGKVVDLRGTVTDSDLDGICNTWAPSSWNGGNQSSGALWDANRTSEVFYAVETTAPTKYKANDGKWYDIPSGWIKVDTRVFRIEVVATGTPGTYEYSVSVMNADGTYGSPIYTGVDVGGGLRITNIEFTSNGNAPFINTSTTDVTVVKTSSNVSAVANNNCYSLAGTTYGLYTSNGTLIHTFVINASGTTDTFKITDMTKSYYVQEITAGPGYALDTAKHNVDFATAVNGLVTITVEDNPVFDPISWTIRKVDPENWNIVPDVRSFSGAVFRVYYYDRTDILSAADGLALKESDALAVAEFTIDSNGSSFKVDIPGLKANAIAGAQGDYWRSYNGSGYNAPLGTYVVKEVTAPSGYNLPNGNASQGIVFRVYQTDNVNADIKAYFGTVTGNSAFGYLDGNYVVNEPSKYGWARLIKKAEDNGTPVNGSFEVSFAGTTYGIYADTNGDGAYDDGEPLMATVVFGADGHMESVTYADGFAPKFGFQKSNDRFELPSGNYVAIELKAAKGYYLNDECLPFTVEDNSGKVTEVTATDPHAYVRVSFTLDKESVLGNSVSGAVFTVYADPKCTKAIGTLTDDGDGHYVFSIDDGILIAPNSALQGVDGVWTYVFDTYLYVKETEGPDCIILNGSRQDLTSEDSNAIRDTSTYTIHINLSGITQNDQTGTLSYTISSDAISNDFGSKIDNYDGLTGYETNPIRIANNLTGTFSESNALSLVKRTETPDNFDITGTVFSLYDGSILIATYKYEDGKWQWFDRDGNAVAGTYWEALAFDTTYTVYEDFDPGYFEADSDAKIPYEVVNVTDGWVKISESRWSYTFTTPSFHDMPEAFDFGATNNKIYGNVEINKVWSQERAQGEDLSGYVFIFEYGGTGDEPSWTGITITRVTDSDGNIALNAIPIGWYRVRENNEGNRCEWSSDTKIMLGDDGNEYAVFNLEDKQTIEYDVINIIRVNINVNKIDLWTGEVISDYEGDPVRFNLYRDANNDGILQDEERLHNYTIAPDADKDGRVVFTNIGVGNYFIVEQVAPFGFYLESEPFYVQVKDAKDVEVNVSDAPYTASITIHKLDCKTLGVLEGAEFTVYEDLNGNGVWDEADTVARVYDEASGMMVNCNVTWDAETKTYVTDGLRAGKYIIVETKLPDGYFYCDKAGNATEKPNEVAVEIKNRNTQAADFAVDTYEVTVYNTKPDIKTTATDANTGTSVMTYSETVTIADEVYYEGLIPGKNYVVEGTLMDTTTGLPYVGPNGETYVSSTIFKPEFSTGKALVVFENVAVPYTVNSLVVFEDLYNEDKTVKLATHADISDEDQTVHRPTASTTATIGGEKAIYLGSTEVRNITITDTISYSGLEVGKVYRAEATLYKADGTQILVNGNPLVVVLEFVPKTADGTVEVQITFSSEGLSEGDKIVVFEKIYDVAENGEDQDEDILIAVHEDLSDEGQTVTIHFRPSTGEILPTYTKFGAALLAVSTLIVSLVIRRKKKHAC